MATKYETTACLADHRTELLMRLVAVLLLLPAGSRATELGPFIRNFELLSYPLQANSSARRTKRATADTSGTTHIRFSAQGRDFHLVLGPDVSAFSNDFVARTPSGPVDVDFHTRSPVTWRISTGDGRVFYVEPAWRYPALQSPQPGHSIVYAAEDVRLPPELQGTRGGCGLDRLQKHLVAEGAGLPAHQASHLWRSPQHRGRRIRRSPDIAEYPGVGTQEPRTRHRAPKGRIGARQASNRRLCHLQIVVDHHLYEFFAKDTDDKTARERITSLVNVHITSTNVIYSAVDFDGIVGMRFVVQDLRINDTGACNGPEARRNPFCRADLDATVMLKIFSYESRNEFCLSYAWTYRDLGEGTLGLAYLAYASKEIGGVCEKYRRVNTREGTRLMALNSGVVTFSLHGGPVAQAVSEVTVAHEFGHSFGSPHDQSRECAPGGVNGNFIMYPRATTGLRPNNRRFSSCSVGSISRLLHAILNRLYDKENCFLTHQQSFCGNNVHEEGEQCDCGFHERDCRDKCCYAPKNQAGAKGCTLKPNAMCSPSAGACCTGECGFTNALHVCAVANECNEQSRCTGAQAQCPEPPHKPDHVTECNNGTQVCIEGRCEGSICQKYQYEDCQRVSGSPADMCLVDCKAPGSDGPCLDTCKEPRLRPICGKKRERGAACNENRGYCDVFRRCRTVDEGGPLNRLEQLLVPNRLRAWIKTHTWLLAIMGVLVLISVLLFIRFCAVMTPTNNPRLPRAKTFKESVRHPLELLKITSN
ncbi:hypothetical protein HPB48_010171 [Haemaphysalis longicornis]|uniref:ADAM10 endopeptidase n=1 Tax=Haemaphysalis longicornis TaxID=44386 RepID=A0A9J6FYB0_HAELO|nr:hypothetical protein HPB48_010171 [Haemaphysalis longicornis]